LLISVLPFWANSHKVYVTGVTEVQSKWQKYVTPIT